MNKISSRAFAVLLIVSRLSAYFTFPAATEGSGTNDDLLAVTASFFAICLISLPLFFISRSKYLSILPQKDESKIKGYVIAPLLLIAAISASVDTVINLQHFISSAVFPSMIFILGASLICAAAFFGAVKGFHAISRAAVFAAAALFALAAMIIITEFSSLNPTELYFSFITDSKSFFSMFLKEISAYCELIIFAVFYKEVENPSGSLKIFLIASPLIILAFEISCRMLLGNALLVTEYPVFIISSFADIAVFRRMDGFYAMIAICFSVIRLSLLFCCAKRISEKAFHTRTNLPTAVFAIISVVLGWYFGTGINRTEAFRGLMCYAAPAAVCTLTASLLAVIFRRKARKGENNE